MIDIKPDPETMAWFRLFSRYISKHSAAIFKCAFEDRNIYDTNP
ncbi:MAG: hypothetical protein WBN57_13495 [Gammaproteobacteria bacterium]